MNESSAIRAREAATKYANSKSIADSIEWATLYNAYFQGFMFNIGEIERLESMQKVLAREPKVSVTTSSVLSLPPLPGLPPL